MLRRWNKLLVFVAVTVTFAMIVCVALFCMPKQEKAEATPSNARNLEVAIVWSDNVEAHLGQSSSVTLYQNGAAISTVTLSSPLWWYQWTGLDSAASYDVRQNTTFANYYTEYAWDANNNVTIKNIQNGSPVPPWPTPQPEPGTWTEETIVIYGDNPDNGTNATEQNNQNDNAETPTNNSAIAQNKAGDFAEESNFDFGAFFNDLFQNINKGWLVILGIIGLFALFIYEKISARE